MTKVSTIPFQNTGFFSKTICDYLEEKDSIKHFYNNFPRRENFKKQIELKQNSFQKESRETLVKSLKSQYKNIKTSSKTQKNIEFLSDENTFTITTGHQLNLFTGPLYFLYKIISTINLTEELKIEFPDCNFVPIYWMASEDHDFEEIQYFNFKGKKIVWNSNETGGVGRFKTIGFEEVFNEFSKLLGSSENAKKLRLLFRKAYVEKENLTEATRYLANELFTEYGLVIVDGDDVDLKRQLLPYVAKDLFENISYNEVNNTIQKLQVDYKIQVNPREINLFYLTDNLRERIVFENDVFKVNNTNIEFNEDELLYELKLHPERFSPNVIMRPLYQEVILPNLCYIGGGGELAYWFELKQYFDKVEVPFPILLLRNSALLISEKRSKKLKKLSITDEELFLKQHELTTKKIKEKSTFEINFSKQRFQIETHFQELEKMAKATDKSFIGAVNAQKKKQLKGLDNLEKRLLKAEKRVHLDLVNRITELQDELFPKQSLQERNTNFSEFYLEYGGELIPKIKSALKPLTGEFIIIRL